MTAEAKEPIHPESFALAHLHEIVAGHLYVLDEAVKYVDDSGDKEKALAQLHAATIRISRRLWKLEGVRGRFPDETEEAWEKLYENLWELPLVANALVAVRNGEGPEIAGGGGWDFCDRALMGVLERMAEWVHLNQPAEAA